MKILLSILVSMVMAPTFNASCRENIIKKDLLPKEEKAKAVETHFPDTSKLYGWWRFTVKDSIDFSIELLNQGNSIYSYYSISMFNGKYLNSSDFNGDYSFKISKKDIFDSSKYISVLNHYDGTIVAAKVFYDSNTNTLFWKLPDIIQEHAWLPKYAELTKSNKSP